MDKLFQSINSDALRAELDKLGEDNLTHLKSWAQIKPFAAGLDQNQQHNFLTGFTASVLNAIAESDTTNDQLKQAVETVMLDVIKNSNKSKPCEGGDGELIRDIPAPTPYIFLPPDCSGQVQPDTFLKDFSYSMGDWSPFDECNRSIL